MDQLARLGSFIAKRSFAASAAALLMVGGGVAIAQNGANGSSEADASTGIEAAASAIVENTDLETITEFCDEAEPNGICDGDSAGHTPGNGDDDQEIIEIEDEEAPDDGDREGDATAFSTWVQSIPSDWGCIRGQLISSVASGKGPLTAAGDLPMITTPEAAAEALEIEDRRCVEVALGRTSDDEVGTSDTGDGPPAHAGRPDHAGPPDHAGRPDHAGPPAHAGAPGTTGRPENPGPPDHAGPPAHARGQGNGGGPPAHAGR